MSNSTRKWVKYMISTGVTLGIFAGALMPLSVSAQDVGSDTEFAAERIVMTESNFNVVATGNVKLSNTDLKLNTDKLVVEFYEKTPGKGDLELGSATAEGNVWGEAQGIQITSDHATFDNNTQQAVFWGNVVVTQDGSSVSAKEARMNIETGVYELVGGVKGRIRGSF